MSIALVVSDRDCSTLAQHLKELLPDTDIQIWPQLRSPDSITFAVLWKQPAGVLAELTQLKAVCSLGAGTDFIEADSGLPVNTPILKTVTPQLQQEMAQYVLAYVLHNHRELLIYKNQQANSQWLVRDVAHQPQVALLGLGDIGAYVGEQLQAFGFQVAAYTQSSTHPTIKTHHAEDGLSRLLKTADYVVNILPLTSETKHILCRKTFAYCEKKPLLINVGRGEHLCEEDLLPAIDHGLLSGAVLDVFKQEPLPADHTFWQHPKIHITPHNAARSDPQQSAAVIVKHYKTYC